MFLYYEVIKIKKKEEGIKKKEGRRNKEKRRKKE